MKDRIKKVLPKTVIRVYRAVRYPAKYLGLEAARLMIALHGATEMKKMCHVNNIPITLTVSTVEELSRYWSYASKEPGTLAWIDTCFKEGDVFYDVGANIGQYSLYAALRHKNIKVYSFEPESQNYAALNKNSSLD